VFVVGNLFLLSLMFVVKARVYLSEAHFNTLWRLEKLGRDKHSSLLRTRVNSGHENFWQIVRRSNFEKEKKKKNLERKLLSTSVDFFVLRSQL
jgi:hypothetical protein